MRMEHQRINWRRAIAYAAIVVALILLPAMLFEMWRGDRVSDGITVGGIDISGLERHEAEAKLRRGLEEPLMDPVKASYGGKSKTLTAANAQVEVDVDGMVDEAVTASHNGFVVISAVRNLFGMPRNESIESRIDYSHGAVNRYVRRVAKHINRDPVDARVTFTTKGLGEVAGKEGVRVKTRALRRRIVAAFDDPTLSRNIKVPARRRKPAVERKDLADKYPNAIIVDRGGFRLRLYKKLKLSKTYGIAVGQVGLETPAGLYSINEMQVDPPWNVPNSDWAGDLAGTTVPGGIPSNPLKARWMGIYDGVGIHGTGDPGSIGSAASHGCIRMKVPDVIDLYERVKVGTPVYIG